MNFQNILADRRFKNLLITMSTIAFIYLTVNVFFVGDNSFIFALNQNFYSPFALVTAILAVRLWSITEEGRNKALFAGLSIGWISWFAAELTWGIYSILGQEVPYPSFADAFWIFGYVPIIIGLYLRLREVPVKPTLNQRTLLWIISLVITLGTFIFILLPIIIEYDPASLLESILNIVYPMVDLLLLVVVLRLLFVYQQGNYGIAWVILSIGFVCMSVSDLIFAYTVSVDLYYPDQFPNLVSRFGVDAPYAFSYMIWIVGIYVLIRLINEPILIKVDFELKPVPNSHIIIHTKGDNTIIKASQNFVEFFGTVNAKGMSVREALGLSEQDNDNLDQNIRREKRISNFPVVVRDKNGGMRTGFIAGLAIMESEQHYQGSNLCLRLITGDASLDHLLSDESRSIMKYILEATGVREEDEIKRLLLDYHLIQLKALHEFVLQFSGPIAGDAYWTAIRATAADNELEFTNRSLNTQASLSSVRKGLSLLLDRAVYIAGQYGESREIEVHLQDIRSSIPPEIQENITYYANRE